MIPKNPGIAPKRYPKNQKQPQNSTQNKGTSPYHDICKLPPPPPPSLGLKQWPDQGGTKRQGCTA